MPVDTPDPSLPIWPSGLVDWTDEPDQGTGVRVLRGTEWELCDYSTLAGRVRGTAARLTDNGVGPGDVVAICDPDCLGFVSAFFGTLYVGATALPLPPASPRPSALVDHIASILRTARPRAIAAGDEVAEVIRTSVVRSGLQVRTVSQTDNALDHWPRAAAAEIALLQCTSGSTGRPRGVQVTSRNLLAQSAALNEWHRFRPDDAFASWLPLHHDMGLIGLLFAAVLTGSDLWQLRPEQFISRPLDWLWCMSQGRATITAAPTFGYGYVARRVAPGQIDGLDLSSMRSAIVGAERLAPAPLRAFVSLLAPHGLAPTVLRPAYGLAEATLAVAGTALTGAPTTISVDWQSARPGEPLRLSRPQPLNASQQPPADALVSCGHPLKDTRVQVLDDRGKPVPQGVVGEIAVLGPSVAAGYRGDAGSTSTRFDGPRLHTGDAGFLANGELYIVGRIADGLKVRGRRVYAETVEERIASDTGISVHRCLATPAGAGADDTIAVLLENPAADTRAEAVTKSVRAVAGPSVSTVIYQVPPGAIARTTSGKVRRRHMWQQLVAGAFDSHLINPSPTSQESSTNDRPTQDHI